MITLLLMSVRNKGETEIEGDEQVTRRSCAFRLHKTSKHPSGNLEEENFWLKVCLWAWTMPFGKRKIEIREASVKQKLHK